MSTPGAIGQKHFTEQKTMTNIEIEVSNCPEETFPELLRCFIKLKNALLIRKEQGMSKVVISH